MLDPEQYQVCRLKGTERPFSGKYSSERRDGIYHCICCGLALFDAANQVRRWLWLAKFYAPIEDSAMIEIRGPTSRHDPAPRSPAPVAMRTWSMCSLTARHRPAATASTRCASTFVRT